MQRLQSVVETRKRAALTVSELSTNAQWLRSHIKKRWMAIDLLGPELLEGGI